MEVKYSQISKLSENLVIADSHSLTTLKTLKGLIEKLCEVSHFRKINGLKYLIKFIDRMDCQSIALSLLGNCCVEEESSIYIVKINITSKLFKLLSESKDTYTSKCVSRVLGLMCMHQSCFHPVLMTPQATKVLVESLCSHQLDKLYLQAHLKTIKIMSQGKYKNEMMSKGVTCHLSSLLKHPVFNELSKNILRLIYYFLIGKSKECAEMYDKYQLTLKILVEIVNEEGEQAGTVKNFIIKDLLHVPTLWRYFGSSGVLKLFLDNLKDLQCYKQKCKLLERISDSLSKGHNRGCFKMEGGCEMLIDYLKDPLMKPTYSIILKILCQFTNESLGNINFSSAISLCFNFINECNVCNRSVIDSKFFYKGETFLFKKDELERTLEINSYWKGLDIFANKNGDVPTKQIKLHDCTLKNIQKDEECRGKDLSEFASSVLLFLSGAAKQTTLQIYFRNPDKINTLTKAISTFPHNKILRNIFVSLSYNPIFYQLLLSQMVVPSIHLMSSIHPNKSNSCPSFTKLISSMTVMVHKEEDFFNNRKRVSSRPSSLATIMLLCYIATTSRTTCAASYFRDPLSRFLRREIFFSQKYAMTELIENIYNQNNHLRLLTITSYCYLISTIEDSCMCRKEACDFEEVQLQLDDFDVNIVVADECIRSVKSRLMHHSDVFTAMFEGPYREARGGDVFITDTSPKAFRLFNQILLSTSFNCIIFMKMEQKIIIEVMQLANKYLVKGLEDKLMDIIRLQMSTFNLDELLASYCLLSYRPLLVCCLIHVCKQVSCTNHTTNDSVLSQTSKKTLKSFLDIITLFSQQELIDISIKLIKSLCIHQV